MQRFRGVQKKRWRADTGESSRNFSADQTGFAKASDDDSALARVEKFDRFFEALIETCHQPRDSFGFDAQDPFGGGKAHRASHSRARAERRRTFSSSGRNSSRGNAFAPSESACDGLS